MITSMNKTLQVEDAWLFHHFYNFIDLVMLVNQCLILKKIAESDLSWKTCFFVNFGRNTNKSGHHAEMSFRLG